TERKKIELALERASDALARVNEDLEERVRERTAELERATAALLKEMEQQKILEDQLRQVQKMESLGTLAGGIAHDFNNILNVILGYTLNIPREAGDPEKQAHSVAVIKETVARGVAIVQQLLALGRKNEPQLEPADLNHLLENHAALLHGAFPKTVAVALRPAPGLPPVAVDTNRLNQAILNLSVNARDAMGGAGTLTLGTESIDGARLRRRFPEARAGSYVCIAVADTGPGMESAVRERIFEPFFTTKGQGEGSGLGLTVVYGVAKDHDGFIDVESEPGRGTTFRLYLPERALDAATRRDETAGAAAYPASEVTILLADDEESQLSLVERVLSGAGYRVLVAKNGAEAVELFERHKSAVSLAVLDLGLPKLSGWQSYLAMRKIDPALKVLFASGYVEPEMRTRLRDNGIVDVLKKPYTLEQLLGQIGELLAAGGQAPVRERSA
ncbi:MAG TPA: ATP-binding protein, partial [Candidatus Binatia bacterium]